MEKILSQDEIDALLKGIENGNVETTTPEPQVKSGVGVSPYDFANQDRITRGRMPTLDVLNDFFARVLRNPLSLMMRKSVDITPQRMQLMKYNEFTRTLPVPSSLHIFKMEPLRGFSLLVLEPKLAFALVDIFLGGTGKMNFRVEGREFSAIETKLIQKVVNMLLTELEKVWRSIYPVSLQFVRSEFSPQFVAIVPPTDLVLTIPFELELDQFGGFVTVCIPYSTLEPIKAKLYAGYQPDQMEVDEGWIERFLDRLKYAEVEIAVEVGKGKITAQKLTELKCGDVLILESDISEPLVAKVQGIPKFSGKAGIYGPNKAFQIEGMIRPV